MESTTLAPGVKIFGAAFFKKRRASSGFTLLEMLVALVVFGLVMAGIAQSFRFGLIAWSETTRRAEAPENLAAMDAALTRMIAQAVPGSMAGEPDQLAFTTSLPAGAGLKSGLADVALLAAPDGTFVLRYAAHPPGIPLTRPPPPRTEILAQGVSGFRVSYLAAQMSGPPAWSDDWLPGSLPLLVRLHLDFSGGQSWPDLVVAPAGGGGD